VCGQEEVTADLLDGRTLRGRVYGIDTLTDLAIVKVEGDDLPVAPIGDSRNLKPGQLAIAIGSPLGEFTNTVTTGVISSLGREITVNTQSCPGQNPRITNLVQTDAAINPGNSGGALVNAEGKVIGVNTAVAGEAQGIGFAIPINIAKPIMEQAVAGKPLARPYIGIFYEAVTKKVQQQNQLPVDYGAWIDPQGNRGQPIASGSAAAKAGLRPNDIITTINDQRIDTAHRLDDILTQYGPGDTVTMTVLRGGETVTLELTLGTRPEDP
jgi:S1-C subfamily serine protease